VAPSVSRVSRYVEVEFLVSNRDTTLVEGIQTFTKATQLQTGDTWRP
jgi:hypothetical protein